MPSGNNSTGEWSFSLVSGRTAKGRVREEGDGPEIKEWIMEVILSQGVHKLGKVGDVVKVKDGYARNYLLPRKLAYLATPENLRRIEQQRAKAAAEHETQKQAAQELAKKLEKISCTITVEVNDLDKMYGSVTDQDIAKAFADEGFEIDKKAVRLEKPIEELGIYDVDISLHPEVNAKVRVWVAKK